MKYTIYDVKRLSLSAGSHFFTPEAMKGFEETLKCWSVWHIGEKVYLWRKRDRSVYRFCTKTHRVRYMHKGKVSCKEDMVKWLRENDENNYRF